MWPPARRGHAAAHADDLLVIVGGRQHHSECLRDAWAFNTTSEVWKKTSTPPKGSGYGCRWGHSATAIPPIPTAKDGSVQSEHTIAVFGGRQKTKKSYDYHDSSVWVYSPKWDAWRNSMVLLMLRDRRRATTTPPLISMGLVHPWWEGDRPGHVGQ